MDEPFLKRLCIAGSILSLIGIFVLCTLIQPLEIGICSLSAEHRGKTVSVEGEVEDISNSTDGNFFFTLSRDGCEVKVVMWKDAAYAMSITGKDAGSITVNSTVKVSGEVEVYRGSLQIAVSRPSVEVR
jgi:RecJ-like exonuclease